MKVVVVFVIFTVVGSEGKGAVVHSIWSNRAGLRGYLRGTKGQLWREKSEAVAVMVQ